MGKPKKKTVSKEKKEEVVTEPEKEIIVKTKIVEKKVPTFWTGLLAIILIITYIFTLKSYEPVKNIIISGGVLIYPLSFLIVAIINKYYGFKSARKSIYTSAILYGLFMLLIMIAVFPKANNATQGYNAVVQYIFTNNYVNILDNKLSIFYPTWGQFLGVVVAFIVSHLVFATVHNALKEFTVDYLSVGLGLFIAYVIDRLIFIPILYARGLIKGYNTFDYLIQCLTSEFMASILMTIIIIIIYVIVTGLKKSANKSTDSI